MNPVEAYVDVHSVREEYFSIWMHFNVVQRVKLATEKVIQQHNSIVRRGWLNKYH